ncbi:hypothetical protein B0H13DRAFT_1860897 [Mycena leptocephala]|nr:hypothetical protein B0H13DRAFT_1860897 [Mycena leptocephala]
MLLLSIGFPTLFYKDVECFIDFRMIPLGDIDLQYEIRVNKDTGVVDRLPERQGVRRIYSARVDGRKSRVTVAMYQGESAKEEWQRDIVQYMSVRQVPRKDLDAHLSAPTNYAPSHPILRNAQQPPGGSDGCCANSLFCNGLPWRGLDIARLALI